jgi:hypothetical protein
MSANSINALAFHRCTDRVLTGYANPEPGVYCRHHYCPANALCAVGK